MGGELKVRGRMVGIGVGWGVQEVEMAGLGPALALVSH